MEKKQQREKRFIDLLDTDKVELPKKLRQAIALIARDEAGLDWVLLIHHLGAGTTQAVGSNGNGPGASGPPPTTTDCRSADKRNPRPLTLKECPCASKSMSCKTSPRPTSTATTLVAPRTAEFGGYRRARISSQCLKRAVRSYFREHDLIPAANRAVRTKRLLEHAHERLEKDGREEAAVRRAVTTALAAGGLKLDEKKKA